MSDIESIQERIKQIQQQSMRDPEWQKHLRECAESDARVQAAKRYSPAPMAPKKSTKNAIGDEQI